MQRYNPKDIEPRWQAKWAEAKIYEASEDPAKPKRYVLEYFPYPSGAAMHVGHVRNYTIGDVVSRHARMTGHNVLHPMGWDAFGLPAENYAIKTGISPQQAIAQNTGKFKEQLMRMGFSYDWSREFASSDPEYYKWTQWFFLLLYKRGLAYRQESLQWWCPVDKTVLANEQVENGHCWRCGSEVEKKALKQWFFKITDYADRLAKDLDDVDWSESIKSMQRNWIGRSTGAEVKFKVSAPVISTEAEESPQKTKEDLSTTPNGSGRDDEGGESVTVFTTRADTLFGATFLVLAPEHPLLDTIVPAEHRQQVENYREKVRNKSDIERQETNREKTGVFTGAYAVNPATGESIPIWTADYVLMGYGTGAIMAVPAHDERDNEFARAFNLPIKQVVAQDFGTPLPDCKDADGVNVIGYDPQTGRFMSLQNHNVNMPWLASGGRDEGESYEQNALRELHEESGYQDVKQLIPLGGIFYSYYYNDVKKVNKRARGMNYLAIISESEKIDQHTEEHESYTPQWTDLATLRDGIAKIEGGVEHWLDAIDQAGEAAKAYNAGKEYVAPVFHGEGVMVNSGAYDGMRSDEAREKLVADLSQQSVEEEPVFIQTTEPGAVREDQPFVEREAITAIVKHWSEDKYIGLKWKTVDWETFITGGIEDGQTAETAAIAEIREETGYLNPVFKQDLGKTHAKFFHVPKDQNRFAHFSCLYFELADGERAEISEEEQQNFDVVWLTAEELEQFRLPESHRYIWNKMQGRGPALATEKVNYKMRDWLISRQRYWGAPIPMIHCPKDGIVPVPEDQLPVVLPELTKFEPSGDGRSPLANVPEFVNTTCPQCGGPAERETDTMDGFACSSWYFLRFADPHNNGKAFDADKVKFWLPVDDYIGGAEHAVMHLLYARMWTKVMQDEGLVDFGEPFKALRNQGMILAPDGQKMSKSKGNTIQPDELIDQGYGADAIRVMELFIGPWNQSANWSVEGMGGSFRFLQRIWTLVQELTNSRHPEQSEGSVQTQTDSSPSVQNDVLSKITHRTVKKVSQDLSDMGFNTAIAAMMEAVNDLYKAKSTVPYVDYYAAWKQALETLVQLLAPFAPHMTEELWHELGNETSIHTSDWPTYDPKYLVEDTVTIAVQVNGKLRGTVQAPTGADEAAAVELAKADEKVAANIDGKTVVKTIYVSGKLLNFVVK